MPARNCDRMLNGNRCPNESGGLFSVCGARMRLCTQHERDMRATYPDGVQLVSRFCGTCASDPCICELREHVRLMKGTTP